MHTVHDPLVIVQNERRLRPAGGAPPGLGPAPAAVHPAPGLHHRRAVRCRALQLHGLRSTSGSSMRSTAGSARAPDRPRPSSPSCSPPSQGRSTSTTDPPPGRRDKGAHTCDALLSAAPSWPSSPSCSSSSARPSTSTWRRSRSPAPPSARSSRWCPTGTPLFRGLGFAGGFLVGWGGYALRAGYLPDTSLGRALAALLVLLVLMGISVATGTRVPLWSLLTGAAAMTAAYETTFMITPSAFPYESPTAATADGDGGRHRLPRRELPRRSRRGGPRRASRTSTPPAASRHRSRAPTPSSTRS